MLYQLYMSYCDGKTITARKSELGKHLLQSSGLFESINKVLDLKHPEISQEDYNPVENVSRLFENTQVTLNLNPTLALHENFHLHFLNKAFNKVNKTKL